jgi:hypothetical protein
MIQGSGNLANQYSLLDEQDLSNLRSALDSRQRQTPRNAAGSPGRANRAR